MYAYATSVVYISEGSHMLFTPLHYQAAIVIYSSESVFYNSQVVKIRTQVLTQNYGRGPRVKCPVVALL